MSHSNKKAINIKKNKSEWKDAILDGLVELILFAVLFGVGSLVIALFAWFDIETIDVEPENIGLVVLIAIFAVDFVIHKIVKRKKNKNQTPKNADDDDKLT